MSKFTFRKRTKTVFSQRCTSLWKTTIEPDAAEFADAAEFIRVTDEQ